MCFCSRARLFFCSTYPQLPDRFFRASIVLYRRLSYVAGCELANDAHAQQCGWHSAYTHERRAASTTTLHQHLQRTQQHKYTCAEPTESRSQCATVLSPRRKWIDALLGFVRERFVNISPCPLCDDASAQRSRKGKRERLSEGTCSPLVFKRTLSS